MSWSAQYGGWHFIALHVAQIKQYQVPSQSLW
jgi:hypothetical protein